MGSTRVKNSNEWVNPDKIWVKHEGTWKESQTVYNKVDGVWQQTYPIPSFSNIASPSMAHSGVNVRESAPTRGTGFNAMSDGNVNGDYAMHDGHDGTPDDYPAYLAIDLGYPRAINRIKFWMHYNSFGDFKFQGSNNSASSGDFYSVGTWTDIPFVESDFSTDQNGGGYGTGWSNYDSFEFRYNNEKEYRWYRLYIMNSRAHASGTMRYSGWANFGWELYRTN